MSLKDELDRIRAEASANAKTMAAYEALVAQLGRAQTASSALKVGDAMPGFMLPNAEGRLVFSDELLAKGADARYRPPFRRDQAGASPQL